MRKTVLTITAILIATVSAFSQSDTETRRIKTTALQIYENYKVVMSDLYSKNDYTEDNFMALFESKALIYNDILPKNTPAQLSPARYYENFKTNIKRIYPAFGDFRMGEPVSSFDKWQITCSFTRRTRFRTQKDMNYPEWSFNYVMTIEMDKRYDENKKVYENAKITSVKVDNPLKDFFIVENKENLPLVTKSGETLKDWDKEYDSRIFPNDKWTINDIQVPKSKSNDNIFESSKSKFSRNQTDAHFYQLDNQIFKKNIFGIGVRYSPNTFTFDNRSSNGNSINFNSSSAMSLSLFFGKQLAHKNNSTWFFNVGLDVNRYSYKYSGVNSVTDTTKVGGVADKEVDEAVILNSRIINKMSPNDGKVNITSVSIPLSVQYLYQLSHSKKPVFLSFELGLFGEYVLPSTKGDNITADFHGMYSVNFPNDPNSQPVEFDHYYNYGNQISIDRNLKLDSRFDFGILGGIGLWFTLNQSNLLKFDVSYRYDFNSSLNYTENYTISNGYGSPDQILQQQSVKQALRSFGFGISWVTTIGGK